MIIFIIICLSVPDRAFDFGMFGMADEDHGAGLLDFGDAFSSTERSYVMCAEDGPRAMGCFVEMLNTTGAFWLNLHALVRRGTMP
jgi:hypothetical protein